jgi:cellulose synthase/poly-beta-1,6-N-acetylglucosamine synthase-like glycosyltransferase
MTAAELVFLIVYFGVMAIGALYGSHRYRMAYLYYRHKFQLPTPNGKLEQLPRVTIQLPVFNEEYVIERLITSVCAIEYPRDLLEVQVLDDSTDDTCGIARRVVERMRAAGTDVVYIHRTDRTGFKAGALANGQKLAKGEFVAVFDADFVPAPDFLVRTVPFFVDNKVGMVQVRWGHLNRELSALTQAQSILLDAHFMIEHTARNRSGCFFNFNGTAGIWRKNAIVDAGGWQHDTLTEDLDLSYRAQLKGWQFIFLPEVVSPAEVPEDMNAFKTQQHRWAKGSIQTARKLLPTILKADLPFKVKREAFFHLTNNMAYLVVIVVALLMPLSMIVRFQHGLYATLWLDFPFFVAATLSVTAFYVATQREMGVNGWARLKFLPFLMALGVGMAINNTKAVVEALFKMESGFARTPKTGAEGKQSRAVKKTYRGKASWMPYVELALGAYYSVSIYFAWDMGVMATVPFLLLFQFGFLYVGMKSLWQGRGAAAPPTPVLGDQAEQAEQRAADPA